MEPEFTRMTTARLAPRNLRPLVLCGPAALEKDALIYKLGNELSELFTIAFSHTTQNPPDGGASSQYRVSPAEFVNMVSDGSFAHYTTYNNFSIGITKQTITAGAVTNRIVVLDAVMEGVRQLKALPELDARYVYVAPPSRSVSEARLGTQQSEAGEVRIRETLRRAMAEVGFTHYGLAEASELEYARVPGFYDLILSSENLDGMYRSLMAFVCA